MCEGCFRKKESNLEKSVNREREWLKVEKKKGKGKRKVKTLRRNVNEIGCKIVICTTNYESYTFFHEFVD
jgi:hypothetical protein